MCVNKEEPTTLTSTKEKLIDGWKECIDESSKEIYFWNEQTNEVTWERPTVDQSVSIDEDLELVISETTLSDIEKECPGFSQNWSQLIKIFSISTTTQTQENKARLIQLKTRFIDWKDGGLSNDFFSKRVKEMGEELNIKVCFIIS